MAEESRKHRMVARETDETEKVFSLFLFFFFSFFFSRWEKL